MFFRCSILIGLALVAFSSPYQAAGGQGIPWWVWVIIVVVILLLVWWWVSRRSEGAAPAVTVETPTPASEAAPPGPDDLTRIEGIGPRITGLLKDAGITTFAQVAEADASLLDRIIDEAGITMIDPSTWPEQASLAAAGEWDALQALQDELKGGRRA
jgi:hypothetical protein